MAGLGLENFVVSLEKLAETDIRTLSNEPGIETHRQRALTAVKRLHQELETPMELSRRLGWQEPAHIASIQIALKLGLLEELGKHDIGEEVPVYALAEATNVNEELAARIMRHLASWGTVREIDENHYTPTETSNAFLDSKVSSGIEFWMNISTRCFTHLSTFLLEDGYDKLATPGKGNWEKATGGENGLFAWLQQRPEALTAWTNNTAGMSIGRAKWTSIYSPKLLLEDADSEGPLLVGVGGGLGQDVVTFQEESPQSPGRLFVQDLPAVIEEANKKNPDATIEFQDHDFFTPQPIKGARAYLLHFVLHDWPDEKALEILSHLKDAMRKNYSKLLVAEFVIAAKDADPFNTALDILVMSCFGGRERTERDWRSLFERAGMKVSGIWSLPGSQESVIEVVPA